jgi:thymidylate kinase
VSGAATSNLRPRYAGEDVVRGFLHLLDTKCAGYCILGGYETFPAEVTSDIDFMVSKSDFDRLPQLLKSFADEYGLRLVQVFDHEITARCFVLARVEADGVVFLQLDSACDYRRAGQKWLDADDILARKRRHPRGFWIPSAADAFLYYLIKRIEKCSLDAVQGSRLAEFYREDPEGSAGALTAYWSPASARRIVEAAEANLWSSVSAAIVGLRDEMFRSRTAGADRLRNLGHKVKRLLRPTGSCVAFFGPDGSGKSSVIAGLTDLSQVAFKRVQYYHLRPGLVLAAKSGAKEAVTDPHALPARSLAASLAKLAAFWCDYVLGYWLRIRLQMARSSLVIFDRYFQDLVVDPKRYRYNVPRWLTGLAGRLVPLPDLIFILDAPPEVLQARKQEVSLEESRRQREAYRQLAMDLRSRTRVVVIDTSQPLEACVHDAAVELFGLLEARTAHRYGIGS